MREFTFDVKAFVTVRVKAESETAARRWIDDNLDGAEANLGADLEGHPIVVGLGLDGEHDLVEIDGDAV